MKIDKLQQLDRLMAICRKRGVTSITIDGISFTLTEELPQKPQRSNARNVYTNVDAQGHIDTPDALTPEELLFYSATGQNPPTEPT